MILTRFEKVTFGLLTIGIFLGLFLVSAEVKIADDRNEKIEREILKIQEITSKKPLVKKASHETTENSNIKKININTATVQQLDAIPGVGKTTAERLVAFRKEHGKISDLNELSEVKGLSGKKFSSISKYLSVVDTSSSGGQPQKLNLNFASEEELDALPGVGKSLARAIIETRRKLGSFHSLDDLEEVPGLSEKTFKKFSKLIDVK